MRFAKCSLAAKNGLGDVQGGVPQENSVAPPNLAITERHHEVIGHLSDVAYWRGNIPVELVLDRQIPLVVDRRLNVRVPEPENRPAKHE